MTEIKTIRYMSVGDIALALDVSRQTIYNWIKDEDYQFPPASVEVGRSKGWNPLVVRKWARSAEIPYSGR